jgi:cell wall assembly regulator SMI1
MIDVVQTRISKIEVFKEQKYEINKPSTSSILKDIERELEFVFPCDLRDFYLDESAGLHYSWKITSETLNLDCDNGWLNILSPNEVLVFSKEIKEIAYETMQDRKEVESNEGARALVNDWVHWIPIVSFPNGDAFCIDKSGIRKEVVFLEHDVMDGGPNLHGLKIANDFSDLMQKWSMIAFADIFDWTEGVNDDGIDLTKDIYKSLLDLISE